MCRSIKTLRGAAPPASDDDVRAAARQFVRKVSGYRVPSSRNHDVFESAVDDVTRVTARLLEELAPSATRLA